MSYQKHTYERLIKLDWKRQEDATIPELLFKEYLRRIALWVRALNLDVNWSSAFILDIPKAIHPSIRAEKEYLEALKNRLQFSSPFTLITSESALHWAALEDNLHGFPFPIPSPYEPLLLMYERGIEFGIENTFFNLFGINLVSRHDIEYYANSAPFINLAMLNEIDKTKQGDSRR